MYNIKQITDLDVSLIDSEEKIIPDPLDSSRSITKTYKVINDKNLLQESNKVVKFGYCCEVKGINYPIFLTINNVEKEFKIGKTGMFEFQPEDWKNINDPEEEEAEIKIYTNIIKVPSDIKFVLDYCYSL